MPVGFVHRHTHDSLFGRFRHNIIGPGGGGGGGLTEAEVEAIIARAEKIGTTQLVKEAVTEAKLKNLAVTAAKIGEAAVEATKIAANAVESAKIKALAVTLPKLGFGALGWLAATQVAEVDRTGVADSTKGLEKAFEEASTLGLGLYIPAGKYKIGGEKLPLDLTKVKWKITGESGGTKIIRGFELFCDAGAEFLGSTELSKEKLPVVRFGSPGAKEQFLACRMKFGVIVSGGKECHCFELRGGYSNSVLEFNLLAGLSEAERTKATGFIATVEGGLKEFLIANNWIHVNQFSTLENGFATIGQVFKEPNIQFAGNHVVIDEIIAMSGSGIVVDSNGTGHNSELNFFDLGDVENCTVSGVTDSNGNNHYHITSANANGADFVLTAGAVAASHTKVGPYVRGNLLSATTVNLNKQAANLFNSATKLGKAVTPAIPASKEEIFNTGDTPVDINIVTKTTVAATVIKRNAIISKENKTEIWFFERLLPGEGILLEYEAGKAPAWNWFTSV
jgi:hypothetical protein